MVSLAKNISQSLRLKFEKVKSDLDKKFDKATKREIKERGLKMKVTDEENAT